jgi:hypothetical protein
MESRGRSVIAAASTVCVFGVLFLVAGCGARPQTFEEEQLLDTRQYKRFPGNVFEAIQRTLMRMGATIAAIRDEEEMLEAKLTAEQKGAWLSIKVEGDRLYLDIYNLPQTGTEKLRERIYREMNRTLGVEPSRGIAAPAPRARERRR